LLSSERASPFRFERISEYATADLAYILELERWRGKVGGVDWLVPMALRVTTLYRREDGGWKIAHRHADAITVHGPLSRLSSGRPIISQPGTHERRATTLKSCRVHTTLPVSDLARARVFYENALGIPPTNELPSGIFYECGDRTRFVLSQTAGKPSGAHTQGPLLVEREGCVPSQHASGAMAVRQSIERDHQELGLLRGSDL